MDNIEAIAPSQSLVDIGTVMSLRESLVKERNCQHKILFSQMWPIRPNPVQIKLLMQNQQPKVD